MPAEIPYFRDRNIISVKAGTLYSLALGSDGQVYGMGVCESGEFGTDCGIRKTNVPIPIKLQLEDKNEKIESIEAGIGCSAFITSVAN